MFYLKELSTHVDIEIYQMLQTIPAEENSFTNPVYQMDIVDFQRWLQTQYNWSKGINLPEHYVGQTIFWFYSNSTPVGFGKIRHKLTSFSRLNGGNIGYCISPKYRNHGYGRKFLSLLINKAKAMSIDEILLTVDLNNLPSKKVVESVGGKLVDTSDERYYYSF